MGAPSDTSADLWNLGSILYELLSGKRLFDPFFLTEELGLSMEESHLIQIIEIFGEFPRQLLAAVDHSSRWFTESGTLGLWNAPRASLHSNIRTAGRLKTQTDSYPKTLEALLRSRLDDRDVVPTTTFLATLLQICPQDRSRATDVINHPWFAA